MDPYYQQQSGQQVSSGPPIASRDQIHQQPSAPSMQNPMSPTQGASGAPGQGHHHHQHQQSMVGPQHHQSGSGSHQRASAASVGYASQQQQQAAYMDQASGGQMMAAGAGTQMGPGQSHHHSSSGRSQQMLMNGPSALGHHHGGQAPPLPQMGSAGGHHQSSGRYGGGGSHRQAAMHQHRSSAAAISDPMMASTITDQLSSATGPMTGSGGALNHLGGQSALGAGLGYGPGAGYYPGEPLATGYQAGPPVASNQHQSRYDTHYSASGRPRHHSHHSHHQHQHQQHQNLNLNNMDFDSQTGRGYYGPAGAGHQSLGNLPAASGRAAALGGDPLAHRPYDQFGGAASGLGHQLDPMGPAMGVGLGLGPRAGSMPPMGSLDGAHLGLGSYNPLEDPLMANQQLGHHPAAGQHHLMGRADGLLGGHSLVGQQQQLTGGAGGLYPSSSSSAGQRDAYVTELRARLQELQASYAAVKRELETTTQKLGSSMHSIKSFWSPELKKERALRKEEATKYALINDQMKLMRVEVQKQALLIRQLEDELRLAHETRIRTTDPDIQQHIDALCIEKENLFKENCLLRDTIRELEMRLETQKQTLAARDDSIKKMVEMMNNKGLASKIMEDERLEMDRIKTRNIELEARLRHYETIIENKEKSLIKSPDAKANSSQPANALETQAEQNNQSEGNEHKAPKSPVPKQRKSLLSSNGHRPSKAERLKSRIASNNNSSRCPLPSKERLNELLLKSSSFSLLSNSNSSSGISSSRSTELITINDCEGQDTRDAPQARVPLGNCNDKRFTNCDNYKVERNQQTASVQEQEIRKQNYLQLNEISNQPHAEKTSNDLNYKLCQCTECQTSGQEIYSRRNSYQVPNNSMNPRVSRASFPLEATQLQPATRKAVSFRPSVEHIGSPSYRLLNDFDAFNDAVTTRRMHNQVSQQDRSQNYHWSSNEAIDDSCDSLHVTKDQSIQSAFIQPGGSMANNSINHKYDDGYLRPLDSSTPKIYANTLRDACDEQVVKAEVHHPRLQQQANPMEAYQTSNSVGVGGDNYTCLCSADFICVHNYPNLLNASGIAQSSAISNSNYAHTSNNNGTNSKLSDFALTKDCIDCQNLSTYVNISRQISNDIGNASGNGDSVVNNSVTNNEIPNQMSTISNGYDSGEYKQLLNKQQVDVYGQIMNRCSDVNMSYGNFMKPKDEQQHLPTRDQRLLKRPAGDEMLDEQMHYLSAARRLQQTLDECALCNEHLLRNSSSILECTCPLAQARAVGPSRERLNQHSQERQDQLLDLSSNFNSTKSFHTANESYLSTTLQQSSLQPTSAGNQTGSTSKLSVLPLQSSNGFNSLNGDLNNAQDYLQPKQLNVSHHASKSMSNLPTDSTIGCYGGQNLSNNQQNNNMDSSLSSLFVYRHISDDNAPEFDEFDPDSLEVSRRSTLAGNKQQPVKQSVTTTTGAQRPTQSTNWLKPRPRSEYISLSSTTSSLSAVVANGNGNHRETAKQPSNSAGKQLANGKKFVQVDSDLTQSSLAKRRQLANQLQQQQQQQPSNKRKLISSKSSSRSSPNVSKLTSTSASSSNLNRSGSSNNSTSNVKSIYQCVKNHLLDITSSSSSKSSNNNNNNSNTINCNRTVKSNRSATLPTSSSASLPRDLGSKSSRSSKSAQMEELRSELARRDQEMLTMGAKMKALEDQQRDSQRHIRVLKDSLVAKEEHYNLLLADVEELRRNLDERNKLIERRSYQQTFAGGATGGAMRPGAVGSQKQQLAAQVSLQELQEMQGLLEMRDKRIGELQRKVIQLDNLLAEKDAQLERARIRLEHSGAASGHQLHLNQPDAAFLNHLEETLGDKEKQISLLREQRDRIDHELSEERDSHERSVKEYKMKLNSVKFEMDKLQNRMNKGTEFGSSSTTTMDRFGTNADQQQLIKRLELDKRSLQLECDRLRDKLESGLGRSSGLRNTAERSSSALGCDYSVVEFERLQEQLESQKQDLRRAQAECRMNEMERKRAQDEADKLSERSERLQSEMHKLKAKLENATTERDQLMEEQERQQQLISKAQTERDCALADVNQIKMDTERVRQDYNKLQLESERNQAQLERMQLERRKLEERLEEMTNELRQTRDEKLANQRELKRLEHSMKTAEMQQERLQQEREMARVELEKVRERHDRFEAEMERYSHDKELQQQQVAIYKERLDSMQQQASKWTKEREQMSIEIQELRDRLHKLQKLQDTNEHETRNEVRIWKEKYERLLAQFEKLNEETLNKQKESQMVMEKLQRAQSDLVKLEAKLEQSEMDRERMVIEVEKYQQISIKSKEDHKIWQDELQQLKEVYTKTNTKLLKLTEIEERLRIDHEKCQMDLEVLRERYEKLQLECRKLQQERDRLQVAIERIRFDNERLKLESKTSATACGDKSAANQDDLVRLNGELERTLAKLEQYQREISKLQLEKERLILDGKAAIQQTEQQHQQQVLKLKSSEEKLAMELERSRLQLDKVQSKCEQTNVDQEKLFADKERLQQQLLLLQQEVEKFRNQQNSSVQETKRLHDEEMQRILQELETIRDKYTQQRKELLQLRELQQNHEIDKDILRRELEAAEGRLEKFNQQESKQMQDSERCMIEIEKMRDKIERKQQELIRTQKERDQFAQEIQLLHRQIQQLQTQYEQQQQQSKTQQQQQQQQQSTQQAGQQQQQPQQQSPKPDEINKLKQMLVKSESELQKTMAENQRLQMEIERLKLQLDDAAEYIGKIENENKIVSQQKTELLEQLKHQAKGQQQQQQQQQNQQQLQQHQQDLERAQQEMKKMQEVIKKSAQEIQRMVDEKSKLQDANKEMQRIVEQTKVEFSQTIEQYEAELDRLQKESQNREMQLQQQVQQQQQQIQQQQKQQPQPQQQATNNDTNEYKVKFEKAVEAIKAFQKTSDDMKKEIIKLNERNKALSEQNQALAKSLKSTEDNLGNADQSGNQQQHEMRNQIGQLRELCSRLEKDLNKSHEETKQQLAANQQLKQAVDKSQAEFSSVKSERDRFQSQLEKLVAEFKDREEELTNLRANQDKSGQNVQAKQGELQAYQKQLEEREKALEAKRQELNNLSNQLQQQKPNQQHMEMIANLQQQVKNLEEERNKLRAELERVRNELKQAQAELERLLKILSASEEEKFNLTQQIDQIQSKLKSVPQMAAQQAQQQPQQARGQTQKAGNPQQPQNAPRPVGPATQQQRPGGPPQGPQQAQPRPGAQQQQQPRQPAPQGQQRSSGAGGFISGFFQ